MEKAKNNLSKSNQKAKNMRKRIVTIVLFAVVLIATMVTSMVSCTNEPHVHAFGEWTVMKNASCEENGITERFCECGEKQVEEVFATGHTFGEWKIVKEATCVDEGTERRECVCGKTETRIIEKTNIHHEVIDHGIEPTCENSGLTEGKHCSVCDKVFVEQIVLPSSGHKYNDRFDADCNTCGFIRDPDCRHENTIEKPGLEPTCISAGYTEETVCTNCEEILVSRVNLDPLGHIEGEWAVEQEPACTANGLEAQRCTRCKAIINSAPIDPTGHSSTDWNVEKEPTCIVDGLETQRCATCSFLIDSKVIKATGHVASDWIVENEATCEQDGNKYKECVKCKEKLDTEAISAIGHNYISYICSNCKNAQDGAKQVFTIEDLIAMSNDLGATYVLMNDIDCQGVTLSTIGTNETNAFVGIFDGRGYTISNYKPANANYMGIIGYNSGTVRNLNVENVVIEVTSALNTEGAYIGGVVGYNAGKLESCKVVGNISAKMSDVQIHAGLITGYNVGTVENVVAVGNVNIKGSITGESNSLTAGGVVGVNDAKLNNAFVNVSVYIQNTHINFYANSKAGIVCGKNGKKGTIDNCLILGTCTGGDNSTKSDVCAINSGSFSGCYKGEDVIVGNQADIKTLDELNDSAFYELTLKWSKENWNYSYVNLETGDYPMLIQN